STCSVAGFTVTLLAAGTCTVNADQPGNANYNAAPTVAQSFTIAKAAQAITFGTLAGKVINEPPFAISATASSGLAVTFSSTTPGQCSVSGNTVTLIAVGTCTIAANQAGNGNYNPAPQVTQSFPISPLGNFSLTVFKGGTGNGTVTSAPAGINCGSSCTANFTDGTVVNLSVVTSPGSVFNGWGGACSGTGACQVTVNAAKTVTATFTQLAATITVTREGAGSGLVTSAPAGIDCGATCAAAFNVGQAVTLTAAPNATSTFAGWSGSGCSG